MMISIVFLHVTISINGYVDVVMADSDNQAAVAVFWNARIRRRDCRCYPESSVE